MIISIFSCKKSDINNDFPISFVKRVVIEEFTGEWCSSCVSGAKQFQSLLDENPSEVFGAAIHYEDPFQLEYPTITSFLIDQFNISYYPDALFDRTADKYKGWSVQAQDRLEGKSNLGLKIETNIEDKKLDIKIDYASYITYEDIHLTVYLVENNVPESSPGAQSAGGGNYIHQHVLREVISGKIGDPIELSKNTILTKEYLGINIGKYKSEDLKVLAFLHFNSAHNYEVLNANQVNAGESADW